jgi:hypothetical protein
MSRSVSSPIGDRHRAALRILCDRLRDDDLVWTVTGSLGFALQGVSVTPRDIDLQTTAAGAYEIERRCSEYATRPVAFAIAERIQSHFGALDVGGMPVEIMGDIQKCLPDGSWGPPTDLPRHRRYVAFEEERIPVLSLAYEAAAYRTLGRLETAAMLERWLRAHPGES